LAFTFTRKSTTPKWLGEAAILKGLVIANANLVIEREMRGKLLPNIYCCSKRTH